MKHIKVASPEVSFTLTHLADIAESAKFDKAETFIEPSEQIEKTTNCAINKLCSIKDKSRIKLRIKPLNVEWQCKYRSRFKQRSKDV